MLSETADTAQVVRLLGVPAALFIDSQNHQHDLIRELTLIDLASAHGISDTELPRRLADLISEILDHYAGVRLATREQALAALARGESTVDLSVPVVPDLLAGLRRWLRLVQEADELCSQGALLTLAAAPQVRALRRWYVDAIATCLERSDTDASARYGQALPPVGEPRSAPS